MIFPHLQRDFSNMYRKINYPGKGVQTLGKIEARYLELLWRNRGHLIDNEWAYQVVWPHLDRLTVQQTKRLDAVNKILNQKMPNVIQTVFGLGRYIPQGSGILIQPSGTAREVWLAVRPTLGVPLAKPVPWPEPA